MNESHDNGIFITFEHYTRLTSGEVSKTRDQIIWKGSLDSFRKKFPGVAVIGYSPMEDGQVGQVVRLNETLKDRNAQPAQKADGDCAGCDVGEPRPVTDDERKTDFKILRDGDSYIKICGGKVYKLEWQKYDDASAEFDKKIKVGDDGEIVVTAWRELGEK